jgi:SAM-dependent methyltransferase
LISTWKNNNLATSPLDLPVWDPYYYSAKLLKKSYEETITTFLTEGKRYRLLDYGCGFRPYKYIFDRFNVEYIGADIGDNPDADVRIEPGEEVPFKDCEFDIIMSSQVLEHVEDASLYLRECRRLLKPNGLLFISTHGTWQYHGHPYDYQRWTSYGLKSIITKSGFEIIEFRPMIGQLALTSQLRVSFLNSFFVNVIPFLKILFFPISFLYQIKMMIEDLITPKRVKERDSATYLIAARRL